METRIYTKVPSITIEDLESALSKGDLSFVRQGIVSIALNERDRLKIEQTCEKLSKHSDEYIRGNAILGLAHVTMRFRELSDHLKQTIENGLLDSSEYVRGHAWSAASDASFFLKWNVQGFVR